jgi:hypothetical protein
MAKETNIIRINPNKPSTLEFEVTISGLENIAPTVRFVILNVQDGCDFSMKCKKLDGAVWSVAIPVLPKSKQSSCKFCVEVIVEEYYFKPAEGEIEFISEPDVSFKSKSGPKPTVTTSFVVKQDNKVTEAASGGGEITGQYAPTNSLLKKEMDPAAGESHVKMWDANQNDEQVDKARLDQITDEEPFPGEGNQYPQDDGKDDEFDFENEPEDDILDNPLVFDPDKVAENIVKSTIGNVTRPIKLGSLFNRDADGKLLVPGFESKEQQQHKDNINKKVREMLR